MLATGEVAPHSQLACVQQIRKTESWLRELANAACCCLYRFMFYNLADLFAQKIFERWIKSARRTAGEPNRGAEATRDTRTLELAQPAGLWSAIDARIIAGRESIVCDRLMTKK